MNLKDKMRSDIGPEDFGVPAKFASHVRNYLAWIASSAWTPANQPPDADTTVMLALADGEVWQGYFDGTDWIEVSGLRLASGRVKYWQHNPKHPEDRA